MKMKNLGLVTAGLCALTVARAGAQTDVEITPGAAAVSASTSDTNLPGNAVDNDLGTRWSRWVWA